MKEKHFSVAPHAMQRFMERTGIEDVARANLAIVHDIRTGRRVHPSKLPGRAPKKGIRGGWQYRITKDGRVYTVEHGVGPNGSDLVLSFWMEAP